MANIFLNRLIISDSMLFLFLLNRLNTKELFSDYILLRKNLQFSLVIELLFTILRAITGCLISFSLRDRFGYLSYYYHVPEYTLVTLAVIQFIITLVFLIITFKKNDFDKVYLIYCIYTVWFLVSIYTTVFIALLEVLINKLNWIYIFTYVLYNVLL